MVCGAPKVDYFFNCSLASALRIATSTNLTTTLQAGCPSGRKNRRVQTSMLCGNNRGKVYGVKEFPF